MLDEIIQRVRSLTKAQQKEILQLLRTWQTGRQRDYQRLKIAADIDVVTKTRVIQSDTRDISASGIFVRVKGKFDPGESVRLGFSIPGYDKPFKLEGKIVRVEKEGVAIRFEKVSPYFKKMLDDMIWNNKEASLAEEI